MGLKNLFSNMFKKQEETQTKQDESTTDNQEIKQEEDIIENQETNQEIKQENDESIQLEENEIKTDIQEDKLQETVKEEELKSDYEKTDDEKIDEIQDVQEENKNNLENTDYIEISEDENIQDSQDIQETENQDMPFEDEEIQPKEEKKGLFARLKAGLQKTSTSLTEKFDNLFKGYLKIDEDLYEEIEEILITSDISFQTTIKIVDTLKENIKKKNINDINLVKPELKEVLYSILDNNSSKLDLGGGQSVIVIVGVNGVGKTTSIGKLALKLKSQGKSVLLGAGDTFRAAAGEQLEVWSKRAGVDIVMHRQDGADPSAVIYDAIQKAKTKNIDVLICDTAGRLHNKKNLMNELSKIMRTIEKEHPNAKKEVLLVIDATTGQNALNQVKTFNEVVNLTGVILTKLDGTAKGGVVLSIIDEHSIPVKFIGVGEKVEDLQEFDSKSFVDALFDV